MRGRRAFVTLVTNDDYALGATALLRSLRRTGTSADLVVLRTGGASEPALAPLAALGARLVPVELLPTSPAFNLRHQRARLHAEAPFTKGDKPAFHTPLDNFAKLRLWQLTEYERCVFLDADTLVLRPVDRLFDYPEFSAAPNVYEFVGGFSSAELRRLRGTSLRGHLRRHAGAARRAPRRSGSAPIRPSWKPSFPTGKACRSSSTCCNMCGSTCPSCGTGIRCPSCTTSTRSPGSRTIRGPRSSGP